MIFKRNLTSFTRILLNSAGNKGGSSTAETNAKSNQKTTAAKQSKSPSETLSQPKKETKKADTTAPSAPPPPPKEPFRNDQYNCKEYFSYDRFSFFAIDLQMSDKRLPQKSNKQQYK